MSRNSSGVYSLYTPGNPVVTNTAISSAWANNTLSDLATAMTDSLSRSNLGGMLAQLQLFDGAVGAPGLSWATEPTSGLYRAAANDFRWAMGGSDVFSIIAAGLSAGAYVASSSIPKYIWVETDAAANNRRWDALVNSEQMQFRVVNDADSAAVPWLSIDRTLNVVDLLAFASTSVSFTGQTIFTAVAADGGVKLSSVTPDIALNETDGAANNRLWRMYANAEQLNFDACNDALSAANSWLAVDRTGTTIDIVNFPNGVLQYGGLEVGYRHLNDRTFAGNDNTTAADAGKMVSYTGAGGHTFTADGDPSLSAVITVRNAGTGNLTLAGSASLQWYNGSGVITFGNRTLAVGGIVTMYQGSAGNYLVWGTGLS